MKSGCHAIGIPTFGHCHETLAARGYRLCALVPGADVSISQLAVDQPLAVVFGNESTGLSAHSVAQCDERASIPMYGFTQSFNLSVSVALVLQELTRRRREWLGTDGDLNDEERAHLRARWYALSVRSPTGVMQRYVSE